MGEGYVSPTLVARLEGVNLAMLQICECMIHFAMVGFVRSILKDHVSHCSIFWKLPIRTSNFRSFLSRPLFDNSRINILETFSIGDDRFFFEISDEAMAVTRA